VLLLAATNRPEVLDPALTRPGRLSRRVSLTLAYPCLPLLTLERPFSLPSRCWTLCARMHRRCLSRGVSLKAEPETSHMLLCI